MVINKNPIENLKKKKKEVGLVLVKFSATLKGLENES